MQAILMRLNSSDEVRLSAERGEAIEVYDVTFKDSVLGVCSVYESNALKAPCRFIDGRALELA